MRDFNLEKLLNYKAKPIQFEQFILEVNDASFIIFNRLKHLDCDNLTSQQLACVSLLKERFNSLMCVLDGSCSLVKEDKKVIKKCKK